MTVFLQSCQTCLCVDVVTYLCYVMTHFWHHDLRFNLMTYFWRHDDFLTSWRMFDVMTNVLTSWRMFRRPDARFAVMTNLFMFRHTFDVMTYVWDHDDFCLDLMKNFLTSWQTFFMSWGIIWRNDGRFDVMTYFCCCVCIVCLYCPCYIIEIDMIVVCFCN